jgi:putative spermidine/putrescine transport system substrate-binding protein
MRRRDLLAGSFATGISALAAPRLSAQAAGELTFNGAGGDWQDNARRAWLTPFAQQTGIRVTDVFPFDIGKLATMVRTRSVEWDLTDIPAAQVGLAIERDLVERIDYGIVDRSALPAECFGEHTVVYSYYSLNIALNRRRFANRDKPQGWADFFDVSRFPGPRSFRRAPAVTLEAALIADGVAPAQLYPLDVERALRKLDPIKADMRWWTAAAQSVQLVSEGEADMGATFSSRIISARAQGAPIDLVWNQGAMGGVYFVVPKGARNKDNAMRLINFIIQADAQARMANFNRTAPANPNAFVQINPEIVPDLPTAPQNMQTMFRIDETGFWAHNLDAVSRRFEAWLLGR